MPVPTSTRSLQRQRRTDAEASARPWSGIEGAAHHGDAFSHTYQPLAEAVGAACLVQFVLRTASIILDEDLQLGVAVGEMNGRAGGRAAMFTGVGERFLHNAVGRQLHAARHLPR